MNAKKRKRWIRRHGGRGKLRPVDGEPSKFANVTADVTNTGLKTRSVVEYEIRDLKESCRYDTIYIAAGDLQDEPTPFEYFREKKS
jgi:hypothetical protein